MVSGVVMKTAKKGLVAGPKKEPPIKIGGFES
jgi:hypothetical protein